MHESLGRGQFDGGAEHWRIASLSMQNIIRGQYECGA